MMLYTFVKKDGNVVRIGAECSVPEELQKVNMPYSENGFEPADAAEYDEQVLKGAVKTGE